MKKSILAAAILSASTFAQADTYTQSGINGTIGTNGSPVAATKIYRVTCAGNTNSIMTMLTDHAPVKSSTLSYRVVIPGASTKVYADTVDGDSKPGYPAMLTRNSTSSAVSFDFYVYKSAASGSIVNYGAESFGAAVICMHAGYPASWANKPTFRLIYSK
jgi:hypothetical protein